MPFPSVTDDGRTVELDLHGATVDQALTLSRRTVTEAVRRGRSTVKLIHGRSTRAPGRRTIKRALYDEFDTGGYDGLITGVIRFDGEAILSLPIPGRTDPARISILDVQ